MKPSVPIKKSTRAYPGHPTYHHNNPATRTNTYHRPSHSGINRPGRAFPNNTNKRTNPARRNTAGKIFESGGMKIFSTPGKNLPVKNKTKGMFANTRASNRQGPGMSGGGSMRVQPMKDTSPENGMSFTPVIFILVCTI